MNISFFCCKYVSGLKVFSCSSSYEMPEFSEILMLCGSRVTKFCDCLLSTVLLSKAKPKNTLINHPPKFGNDCKHLRESTCALMCVHALLNACIYIRARDAGTILHLLQLYSFIIFWLRSTTEQLPAPVFIIGRIRPND
jgi:hypothetical protein